MKLIEIVKSTVLTARDFLEEAPNDELYTVQEMAAKFELSESTIKSSAVLKPYKTQFDGRNFYGSVKAIAELTKLIGQTNED